MSGLYCEFPNWDGGELPDIPPFTKAFWHNDTCPKYAWYDGETEYLLFVEYEQRANREDPSENRFNLYSNCDGHVVIHAETWDELRQNANDWWDEHCDYELDRRSIKETGQVTPMGQLLFMVCQKAEELANPKPKRDFVVSFQRVDTRVRTFSAHSLEEAEEMGLDDLNKRLASWPMYEVVRPVKAAPTSTERDGKFEKALREIISRSFPHPDSSVWQLVHRDAYQKAFTLLMEVDKK